MLDDMLNDLNVISNDILLSLPNIYLFLVTRARLYASLQKTMDISFSTFGFRVFKVLSKTFEIC